MIVSIRGFSNLVASWLASSFDCMASMKKGARRSLLQRSPPVRMSLFCPMYRSQISKLQRGCVIMKTAVVVADPEPAKSVAPAHMM